MNLQTRMVQITEPYGALTARNYGFWVRQLIRQDPPFPEAIVYAARKAAAWGMVAMGIRESIHDDDYAEIVC